MNVILESMSENWQTASSRLAASLIAFMAAGVAAFFVAAKAGATFSPTWASCGEIAGATSRVGFAFSAAAWVAGGSVASAAARMAFVPCAMNSSIIPTSSRALLKRAGVNYLLIPILFTANRLQAHQHLRYEEVRNLLQSLCKESHHGTQAVDLGKTFVTMIANSLSRAVHSKTLAKVDGHAFPSMLKEQEKLFAPTRGDFLPWLRLLDLPRKWTMRNYHKRVGKIIEAMVSQRRQLMKSCKTDDLPKDLLQALLSREATDQNKSDNELLTINGIKGTILDVLSTGIHTTALTLEWAMAQLLRNRIA
ncbi:hypothetical protein GOP47_0019723 [Adiantum capillus-veneris]|uniref:Cytochrome P450 n=1 Tax=Adiantum capillus-veneris TaxID=13818 RepID=A0A9D4UCK6_ADICA|nr:hypothetical protein GOP47_0019723 [Adiantum capillus-veneris]